MVERLRHIAFAFLSVCAASGVHAQTEPRLQPEHDLELWTSIALETRPFSLADRPGEFGFRKNFRAGLEIGYRSNENLGNGKAFYTDLGLKYRVCKWLRAGMNHRYNFRDRYSKNSYRLDGSVTFRGEWKRFEGSYRTIFQHEFIPAYRLRDVWRNRFAVSWRTKKFPIDPTVSVETFTGIWYKGNYFAGIRYDIGAQLELGKEKNSTLDLVLRHDREIGVKAPLYRTIISLAYEYYWKR
ncbi:MAG: DUF2490 domain-containing protein [Flavobacteriales bacterium]